MNPYSVPPPPEAMSSALPRIATVSPVAMSSPIRPAKAPPLDQDVGDEELVVAGEAAVALELSYSVCISKKPVLSAARVARG